MADFFGAPGAADSFVGQANENNRYFFAADDLTGGDSVTGTVATAFRDVLVLTAAGTVSAADLAQVRNLEAIRLDVGGISVQLNAAMVASSQAARFEVIGSAGIDLIDGGLSARDLRLIAGLGADTLIGGAGRDRFQFDAAALTSADSVMGGGSTGDVLVIQGGAVVSTGLAQVTGVEIIELGTGVTVTVPDAMVANQTPGAAAFSIKSLGDSQVDARAVDAARRIVFTAGGNIDTYLGGAAGDRIDLANGDLTSADQFETGLGIDTLRFTTAVTLAASAFAGVTGIDQLLLGVGGSQITLSQALVAGAETGDFLGQFTVIGSAGNDRVDARAVTSSITIDAGGGADTLTGGGGDDFFRLKAQNLSISDQINGGDGIDAIRLRDTGPINANAFQSVTNVERLILENTVGGSIILTDTMVTSADTSVFDVWDAAGNDSVSAASVGATGRVSFLVRAGGADSFTGDNGRDSFRTSIDHMTNTDQFNGGGGQDVLIF
jgi:Ca2+-binding RTX toxin-like protein